MLPLSYPGVCISFIHGMMGDEQANLIIKKYPDVTKRKIDYIVTIHYYQIFSY